MRHLGNLPSEAQARTFSDLLVAHGIRNEVEPGDGGSWSAWILDDDQVADGRQWLERLRANPDAAQFRQATAEAAKARSAEAEDLARYRQRVRTRKSLFPKIGGYGVGVFVSGPYFGGMSGVVYALAGYIWMRGKS